MLEKYRGEIKIGDRFLWEVERRKFVHVLIVETKEDPAGATSICTRTEEGETRWVDETVFRSSCFWIGPVDD